MLVKICKFIYFKREMLVNMYMFVYFKKGKLNAGKIYMLYIKKKMKCWYIHICLCVFKRKRSAGKYILFIYLKRKWNADHMSAGCSL